MHRSTQLLAVTIRHTHHATPINKTLFHRDATRILSHLRLSDYALSIWLTGDQTMKKKKNMQYRGIDKSTDVLSFPFQRLTPTPPPPPPSSSASMPPHDRPLPPVIGDVRDLGEILISLPYVARQIKKQQCDERTLKSRLRVLTVHGVCHLLGYDHETNEDAEVMETEERRLLKLLEEEDAEKKKQKAALTTKVHQFAKDNSKKQSPS